MNETMKIINELEEELVKINNPSLINKLHIIRLDYASLALQQQISVEPEVKPEIAGIIKMLDKMIEQIETTSTVRPVIKGVELTLVKLIKMNIEKQCVMLNFADRPKIITLIGSTRFINEMSVIGWEFEKQGHIVLNPRLLPVGYANETHLAEKENVKEIIDKTYLHKVEMADEIFVVNIGGYIGDSTRNELRHAAKLNKKIVWLEPESKISE